MQQIAQQGEVIGIEAGRARQGDGEALHARRGAQGGGTFGHEAFHGVQVTRAATVGQGGGRELGQALVGGLEQRIAAGAQDLQRHIGDGAVRLQDHGTALPQIDDLALAHLFRGSSGLLPLHGRRGPVALQNGIQIGQLGLFGRQHAHAHLIGAQPEILGLTQARAVHGGQRMTHIGFTLRPAQLELYRGLPRGQAVQGLAGAVHAVLVIEAGPLDDVGRDLAGVQRGQIAGELLPERLHLVRIQLGDHIEQARAVEAHVADADAVHQLFFVTVLAIELRSTVAAQRIGQHVQVDGALVAQGGGRQGDAQIDLVPRPVRHLDTGTARGAFQLHGSGLGQDGVVLQVAEQLFGVGQHGLGIDVAGHQQHHVLRLVPGTDIGPQVVHGHGPDGLFKADDGAPVDRVGQTGHLQVLEQAAGGRVVTALEFGNDDVLFRFQLGRIQRRMEGHVLDHVHARLPVLGGHVGDEPGLVEAGGRVEIAAQGFHIPGHLPLGTLLRTLEDHMLQHMADARLLGGLVGGTRAYEQARADQREAAVPDDVDRQAVLEADEHGVVTRG